MLNRLIFSLSPGWNILTTKDGVVYYVNEVEKTTTLQRPTAAASSPTAPDDSVGTYRFPLRALGGDGRRRQALLVNAQRDAITISTRKCSVFATYSHMLLLRMDGKSSIVVMEEIGRMWVDNYP